MNKRKSGIYRIRNTLNGKMYIGSAVDVDVRWRCHRRELNKGAHHCKYLQRAWLKYGETSFIFEVIEPLTHKEALLIREQSHIDLTGTSNLYNSAQTVGGSFMLGRTHTAKARTKMAATMLGNKRCVGRRASDKTRSELSIKARARYLSSNGVPLQLLSANLGRSLSQEHRQKLSAAMTGRQITWGAKISEAHKQRRLAA